MIEGECAEWSAIFLEAAKKTDITTVVTAMVMGADMGIKCQNTGNTALHFAAYNRSPELYNFIADPEMQFERDIQGLLADSAFLDVLPNMNDVVSKWKTAVSQAPIMEVNNDGLLPSSCIPEINLSPKTPFQGLMKDFWFSTMSLEYKTGKDSPDGFINKICSNVFGTPFPNIVG
jgi:hypothetical protein